MFPETLKFSVAKSVNHAIRWLLNTHGSAFDHFSSCILGLLLGVQRVLVAIPWWAYLVFIALMAWTATKKALPTIVLAALPFVIGIFGLWALAVETLALVITSVVIALIIGIPLGVVMGETPFFAGFIQPVLDAMQTMPSFVYLIPAMMLFGLGKVPAVIATLIYSLPPVMRLTCLGLRQVPAPAQEAARAYGATRWQLLKEVRIPLAMPSILAGVNQTTMMALAMVVIASMIGARGLGQEVLMAINRIDVGRGFEAGISIVIMGIVIDRITQGLAKRWDPNGK